MLVPRIAALLAFVGLVGFVAAAVFKGLVSDIVLDVGTASVILAAVIFVGYVVAGFWKDVRSA
jgi:hypothetical protein